MVAMVWSHLGCQGIARDGPPVLYCAHLDSPALDHGAPAKDFLRQMICDRKGHQFQGWSASKAGGLL